MTKAEMRRRERVSGKHALRMARKLTRREKISSYRDHHKGMTILKAWLGEPRPDNMTLSLTCLGCPDHYQVKEGHIGRPLVTVSLNPGCYEWESRTDNQRRRVGV